MTLTVYLVGVGVFVGLILLLSAAILVANRYLANYGTCKLYINEGEPLEVEGGQSLLAALYGQKIFIPSACGGQGTCGECKVRVLEGGGQILPTELQHISKPQARAGLRLACQVKVRSDLKLEVPEEYLSVQEFETEVISARKLTHDMAEVRFKLIEPDHIEFRAGQYIQIKVPDPDSADGFVFRAYSISSKPSEHDQVEVVVRQIPGGKGSTYVHNMKVGDKVRLTGPYGKFKLNEDEDCHLLLVGGGAGMAPMKCLITHCLETTPNRPIELYFGARGPKDLFYVEEFEQLSKEYPNFKVLWALSDLQEGEEWDGPTGFIHIHVDKHYNPPPKRQVFLCGPPPMINAVMTVLEEKGLEEDEIFYDKF